MAVGRKFSLESILTLKDQMTGGLGNAQESMTKHSRQLSRQMQDLTVPIRNVDRAMNRAFRVGATAAIGAAVAGLAVATREFVRFDQALTQAGAKFSDLDVTAADYRDRLRELGDTARQVGAATEFSATDAAGALDKMAMAGMTAELSMSLLRGTTDLATAAGTDLTTAVDIATDSIGAFGLATTDAAQAATNLERISDVMVRTTTTANTSFEELFEAVRAGAASFTAAGQEVETFNTLVGAMANAGIKGAQAGTILRNVATRLAAPTGEAARMIEEMGVRTEDAQGNFRDVVDILEDFERGMKGMGTAQRTAAMSTIFGQRAVTGINVLLQEGSESLRAYRDNLEESGGAATTMADAMRQSLGNRLAVIKSSLLELGFRFVEVFEEQGRGSLDKLIEGIQAFDPTPVIDFLVAAVDFGGKAFRVLSHIWPVLVGLATAIKGVAFATGVLGVVIAGATLPVLAIIAGVTALVAAGIYLIRNWGAVKEFFIGMWDSIKTAFLDAWEFIFGIVEKIIGAIERVKDVARSIGGGIADIFTMDGGDVGSGRGDRFVAPATSVAESRQYRETVSRQEVFVRPDRGASLSRTPGGAPEPSLAMGGQ